MNRVDRVHSSVSVVGAESVTAPGHRFVPGGEFTVGVEEELMLVGPGDDLLGDAAAPLVDSLSRSWSGAGLVTGEVAG